MTTTLLDSPISEEATAPTFEFNANQRCDLCGAQAWIRATKGSDETVKDLLFCGHHGKKFTAGLVSGGFEVLDRTDLINPRPSQSSV